VEHTTDSRARIATFGVAFTAALVAVTMNRVQVARAESVQGSQKAAIVQAAVDTTLPGDVVAFG
jgi:hypothetical protein